MEELAHEDLSPSSGGEWVFAYALDSKGSATTRRDFAKLAMPPAQADAALAGGADGMAVDDKGRLFVATTLGVQVFSDKGEALGVIAMPKQPQNLAFGGKDRSSLYVVGRGSVYRIATQTRGPDRPGK